MYIKVLLSSETSSVFLFSDLETDPDLLFFIALIHHQDIKSAGINNFKVVFLTKFAILDDLFPCLSVEFSGFSQPLFDLFKRENSLSMLIIQKHA
jgi:hypothetical protein